MTLYFAPMEGITTASYRRTHAKLFGGPDRYFTPFVTPVENGLAGKSLRELLPENNAGVPLVPQILTNKAEGFLEVCRAAKELGYQEVNLNLGCPSGTVVSKGRGAGFLAHPIELELFLDKVFSAAPVKVSIKTRLGMADAEEFEDLLELYQRYPLSELIIHPRVRAAFYKGHADRAAFGEALYKNRIPVCYNGDIFTAADFAAFREQFPTVERVMLGRGLVANPALARELAGGEPLKKRELAAFHTELYEICRSIQSGEKNVLCRMKEQWNYWGSMFADGEKQLKRIRKSTHLRDYEAAVEELFEFFELVPGGGYRPGA